MNEESPAKSKPGFFAWLWSVPRNMSAAGCASVLLAIFLALMVCAVWIIFIVDPDHVPWRHSMSWTRILLIITLAIVIPWVFYWAVRLWMEGVPSRHPSIDRAWQAGTRALRQHGIALQSTPVFLVLGSPGEHLERALMNASGIRFVVRGVPEGPAPLHWYANSQAIFLVCREASWLSALTTTQHKEALQHAAPANLPQALETTVSEQAEP